MNMKRATVLGDRVLCAACGRHFPRSRSEHAAEPLLSGVVVAHIILLLLVGGLVCSSYVLFGRALAGPAFLAYYMVVLVSCLVVKSRLEDDMPTLIPFFLFEGMGVVRFIEGSAQGMQRFQLLFLLMVLGGCLFFISVGSYSGGERGRHSSRSGSSYSSVTCSSGGGGCGGGGGGCGGCGGS